MNVWELRMPRRVLFGPGTVERLGKIAQSFGESALVVLGQGSLERSGTKARILRILDRAGVRVVLFEGVEPDPTVVPVDRATEVALAEGVRTVIGVGGGSVLDVAKGAAGMVPNGGPVRDYMETGGKPKEIVKESLPLIALPTTSGTGAEATKNAVLIDPESRLKRSIRSPRLIPRVALVDPELTLDLPPERTAACGMDALAQLVEPLVSRRSQPVVEALSLKGIELVGRGLRTAVENGADLRARTDMALASFLSGVALANGGLGAAHGLSHPLGARWGVPHGVGCAILLPRVMEFNLKAAAEGYAKVAQALGEDTRNLSRGEAARMAVEAVRALARDIGIPPGLGAFGITADCFPTVVSESRGSSMRANPVEPSDEDLAEILRRAL